MLVYAPHTSPRLDYILDHILLVQLGISYKITTNLDYFQRTSSYRINYGINPIEGCLNIPSGHLLFEENIVEQKITIQPNKRWKIALFANSFDNIPDFKQPTQVIPFDLFSAAFYLLSRYEEYLPSKRDEHNRYKHQDSIAFKNNFLETPLLDYWLIEFKNSLLNLYPAIQLKAQSFQQINTIDIDFAYKYKGQSLGALTKKFIGSLLKGKPDWNCINLPEKDPYDTYRFIQNESNNANVPIQYFFLLANYGGFDRNLSPFSVQTKTLYQSLATNHACGIHPSYKSSYHRKSLEKELALFSNIFGYPAKDSRNHFLKIKVPETYQILEGMNVLNDYTMAYADAVGFRASTSQPFFLFNLHQNKQLQIKVFSPCLMDVSLKNGLNLNLEAAIEKISTLKREVQTVNGYFISIWHNSSFDLSQGWEGWDKVFKSLFR